MKKKTSRFPAIPLTNDEYEQARHLMKTCHAVRLEDQPTITYGKTMGRHLVRKYEAILASFSGEERWICSPILPGERIRLFCDADTEGSIAKVSSVELLRLSEIRGYECRAHGETWACHDLRGILCRQRFAARWDKRHGQGDFASNPMVWLIHWK